LKYMNGVLINLGVTVVGSIGVVSGRPLALRIISRLRKIFGKKLVKSIRGEIKYPDQDEIHRQRQNIFVSWQNSIRSACS